jgi:hypothetical protein
VDTRTRKPTTALGLVSVLTIDTFIRTSQAKLGLIFQSDDGLRH